MYVSGYWNVPVFGEETEGKTTSYQTTNSNYADLLTTGASGQTENYHLYDVGGNLWEWTEEDSHKATSGQYRIMRGGSCISPVSYTATYRSYDEVTRTYPATGFRVVLYMK